MDLDTIWHLLWEWPKSLVGIRVWTSLLCISNNAADTPLSMRCKITKQVD